MLGNRVLAVRLGGIYALQRLASEHPAAFLPQVVRQYCAFVRHPPESGDGEARSGEDPSGTGSTTLREDVRAVMNAMDGFSSRSETIDVMAGLWLDLSGADLSGMHLGPSDLFGANLSGANLSHAHLRQANLANACLRNADVSGTYFSLGETLRCRVRGLAQDQLDEACADSQDPPRLEGVVDQHGTPLRWRGKPCRDRRSE